MENLHVALHDGFDDDTVEVRVNDRIVYDRRGVTTMTEISRADEFEVAVEGPATVEVRLPERGIAATLPLPDQPGTVHLALSLVDGAIVHRFSDEEFRYA